MAETAGSHPLYIEEVPLDDDGAPSPPPGAWPRPRARPASGGTKARLGFRGDLGRGDLGGSLLGWRGRPGAVLPARPPIRTPPDPRVT